MQRIALTSLVLVCLAVPGTAQDVTAQDVTVQDVTARKALIVTEAEFLSALDEYHPAVAAGSEALALSRARILEASTLENPVLGMAREDLNGPSELTEWTLSWRIPESNRRATIGAREAKASATAARFEKGLVELRLAMKETYADWAFAMAGHELLAAQASRVEALAERQRRRLNRGEAAGLEVRRLELAAAVLRSRVELNAAAVEQARALAAGWWPALPPGARPALPALPAPPAFAEDHPLVQAARKDLAAARLEHQAAASFVRSPEITLGWQREEDAEESLGGPLLGVVWSVPIVNRNHAGRVASRARVAGAQARLQRASQEVDAARAGALASFERLKAALIAAGAASADFEIMLDGTEAAFRHGEASVTDLLETQRSVTEAELAALELHEAALAAHRELERAAGALPATRDLSESASKELLP